MVHEVTVRLGDSVVVRELGEERVMLNLDDGLHYSVDGVASRLVDLLAEPVALGDVFRILAEEFDAPPAVIEADVSALVAEMASSGLVTGLPDDQGAPPPER